MPNSDDTKYQAQEIERLLLFVGGYEKLGLLSLKVIKVILEEHLRTRATLICPVCQSALVGGTCPHKDEPGHEMKKVGADDVG